MKTRLSLFCEKIMETGCLLVIVVTPLFFNVNSSRVFEPDKISLLRSIALIMSLAWIIKTIEEQGQQKVVTPSGYPQSFPYGIWKKPFLLPVLLFVASYLLSTIFSVSPRKSIFGSYLRSQGTYTTLSYILIFFLTLITLKREEQIDRILNLMILTSLPISLYGIFEHYHLDPIAWGNDVSVRVTSSMGNPIFLAAYLIMLVPLTMNKIIDSTLKFLGAEDQSKKVIHLLQVCCYLFILAMQFLCILFTQSRGPWLGLLGGIYIFMLFGLIYLWKSLQIAEGLNLREVMKAISFSILSFPLGILPAYMMMVLWKRGWRWLWLSWIFHTLLGIIFLILLNLPQTPLNFFKTLPYIGRLGEIFQTEAGTGKVRMLIWEGTLNLLKANPLRTVIGYGPETMQLIYGPYYPLDLVHYEQRNTLPDRAHNETFDTLVITGVIGFIIYLFLFGSLFYYGMKWLGFMENKYQFLLFLFLNLTGSILGVFLPKFIEGTYRSSGVGLAIGFIFATCLYCVFSAIFFPIVVKQTKELKRSLLLLALISSIVAHFIEIHFGIAIAVTRLYFWVLVALFLWLGDLWKERSESNAFLNNSFYAVPRKQTVKRTKKLRIQAGTQARLSESKSLQKGFVFRIFSSSLIIALILFTLGFDFCINPRGASDSFSIIRDAFTTLGSHGKFKTSLAIPYLFFLPWILSACLTVPPSHKSIFQKKYAGSLVFGFSLYSAITLIILFSGIIIYSNFLKPGQDPGNLIKFYYLVLVIFLFLISFSLLPESSLPERFCRLKSAWSYPFLITAITLIIIVTNVRPIQADIYYKQGQIAEKEHRLEDTIQFYRKAVQLSPFQDNYYTELSRALIEKSNIINDPELKSQVFEEIQRILIKAQRLDPIIPDHYANLGLLYLKWADLTPLNKKKEKYLELADFYYKKASRLDPHNTQIYDCWAIAFIMKGDYNEALKKLKQSLSKDSRYGYTYFILGELYSAQGKLPEAIDAYQQAINLDPSNAQAFLSMGNTYYRMNNLSAARNAYLEAIRIDPLYVNAHSNLGLVYYQEGKLQEAIEENLKVLQIRPQDFLSHRNLAIIYHQRGEREKALFHAREAFKLSPENEKPAVQRFLEQLIAING